MKHVAVNNREIKRVLRRISTRGKCRDEK